MIQNDYTIASTEKKMGIFSANNSDANCPICTKPLTSARWGFASSPCGSPGRLSCYHLSCWEREVANCEPIRGGNNDFVVPAFVESMDKGRIRYDHDHIISKSQDETGSEESWNASYIDFRSMIDRKVNEMIRCYQFSGAVDDAGIRMGACLERVEASMNIFLHRLFNGEINEIALGAFIIGVLLGVMVINIDEMILFLGSSISMVKMLPWLIRGLWLCILPLIFTDIVRTMGAAMGVKEPMKSSVAIITSCTLTIPLWLVVGEMVFISLLKDLSGDIF